MIEKQTKNTYARLEKVLTLAGLVLIVVGCIANAFSAYLNIGFVSQPIDVIYYFRNIILLGGGFAIGYLLTRKSERITLRDKLFAGVFYAILASSLSWMLDLIRFGLRNTTDIPRFPWGWVLFEGIPLIALITTFVLVVVSQRKLNRSAVGAVAKISLIASFVLYQLYVLIPSPGADFSNTSVWLTVAGYLTTPLVVAVVSFLVLKNVKILFDRLLYASFIGAAYVILMYALWDFRTDASSEATNVFSIVVTFISLAAAGSMLWQARRAIR